MSYLDYRGTNPNGDLHFIFLCRALQIAGNGHKYLGPTRASEPFAVRQVTRRRISGRLYDYTPQADPSFGFVTEAYVLSYSFQARDI
ncbi:unnamed protein product [Protopolystoma xenopodis]|uniref:Uncharacterized protein n=1 Tax=Protopolystoma xenopodis TaxID=117903 RepID=A0A3S5A771_9PLAT|nr:unnamed protein product [Protopolystoma xenopodis]